MSKRLLTLFTVMSMLVLFSVAQAQEAPSGEPIFVLTEDQINAEFIIPSTDTRQISNLVADVQEDGVHLTFELTTISDGTSNTLSIIAVLIGLYRPEVSALELENTMVSNFTASPRQRQAVSSLITRAWRNYAREAFAASRVGGKMHLEDVSLGFHDDGIYVYETEGETAQWCLECSH
jgi:hypothetical protein